MQRYVLSSKIFKIPSLCWISVFENLRVSIARNPVRKNLKAHAYNVGFVKGGITKMPQYDARATCPQIMGTDLEKNKKQTGLLSKSLNETRRSFFCATLIPTQDNSEAVVFKIKMQKFVVNVKPDKLSAQRSIYCYKLYKNQSNHSGNLALHKKWQSRGINSTLQRLIWTSGLL